MRHSEIWLDIAYTAKAGGEDVQTWGVPCFWQERSFDVWLLTVDLGFWSWSEPIQRTESPTRKNLVENIEQFGCDD